jgi:DNA-binding IclR family transcriptional regulator
VAQIDALADSLVGDWMTLPDVADRLGLPPSRVRQLLRDRKLIAVQRPDTRCAAPAAFFDGNQIVRACTARSPALRLRVRRGGSLRWLFTADDSLPGTPIRR